jgi:hypothetical protein
MKTSDEVKNNLKLILRNGDIFDNICLREGVGQRKYSFLKLNILLLSRILYIGVLLGEKIKQYFIKPEKVKKAQDEIRDVLGVNVDFIKYKEVIQEGHDKEKFHIADFGLAILYLEDYVEPNTYIDNLQKILMFADTYHLRKIYLRINDIEDHFVDVDLQDFKIIDLRRMLGGYLETSLNQDLLCLTTDNLRELIKKLKSSNANKEYIRKIGSQIQDLVISKALDDFLFNDDLDTFKEIVTGRLELLLNSDSYYKDKSYGKVIGMVSLNNDTVKVEFKTQKGEIIDTKFMPLWEYLEVASYEELLNDNLIGEEKNLSLLSYLYLFLCNNKKKGNRPDFVYSFYDKIYKRFELKRKKKIKKIKGLYSKKYKNYRNLTQYYSSFVACALIICLIGAGGASADFIKGYITNKDSNISENLFNNLFLPYKYSLKLEFELLKDPIYYINKNVVEFIDNISSSTGDSYDYTFETIMGDVKTLDENFELPIYFATNYATDSIYKEGNIQYSTSFPNTFIIEDAEPLFEVSRRLNKTILKNLISDNRLDVFRTFYPVGDNYALISVRLEDLKNGNTFVINYERFLKNGNYLNSQDIDYLLSFNDPQITYTYGISQKDQNIFVDSLQNNKVYTGGNSNIQNSIIKGLGLSEDASLEDILKAIKNKKYSRTPIYDHHLASSIKLMDENEYFETIASMDSLVCNLAATLAVESTDDLIYVVGYLDDGDGYLSSKESHAWAMNTKGDIVDVTPSTVVSEEDNIIIDILSWGIKNNIHVYTLMAFIANVLRKKFGKKVILNLKVMKFNDLLNNPDIFEAYAKINEVLYGGLNIPRKSSKEALVEKINSDFVGFSKEELDSLKEALKQEANNRLAIKLVDSFPFIRDNFNEIKRILEKK